MTENLKVSPEALNLTDARLSTRDDVDAKRLVCTLRRAG